MNTHVQVNGSELKAWVEKALATKEMQPAIDIMEELCQHEVIELPQWIEGVIVERLRNVGIEIRKNGGWYRCIAAYILLPKMNEIIDFERKYVADEEDSIFEDENIAEQWFEIVKEAIAITVNSISSEFEGPSK